MSDGRVRFEAESLSAVVVGGPSFFCSEPQMASPQRDRLEALKALKASVCYCSKCGARLKYRSFTAHPCFKVAVAKYGRQRARQSVQRLTAPPAPGPDPGP